MEHKLIEGGEIYLPFARSRIKALRNIGLPYASQRYVMPDGEVNVRIAPGNDYIHLAGGVQLLSGVIREGEVIPATTSPPEETATAAKLHEYKPTAQAWKYQRMDKKDTSETAYHDERRLVVKKAKEQYADISPSMFSGLMAKAVAVVMAQGKEVKYDYKWLKCHGILIGPDDTPWLVEISKTNGVLLMKFPKSAGNKTSKQDALKFTAETLKGMPTGGTFPVDADLPNAIESGRVLQLLAPAALDVVYSKSTYSSALGWSFNNHDAAHNTCRSGTTGFHYKIKFNIAEVDENRSESAPIVEASAELSEVEQGTLYNGNDYGFEASVPFSFYEPLVGGLKEVSCINTPGVHNTPILVYHHNGVLDVVRLKSELHESTPGFTDADVPPYGISYAYLLGIRGGSSYVDSDAFPGKRSLWEVERSWVYPSSGIYNTFSASPYGNGVPADTYVAYDDTIGPLTTTLAADQACHYTWIATGTTTESTTDRTRGVWPNGMRDGYIHYEQATKTDVTTISTNNFVVASLNWFRTMVFSVTVPGVSYAAVASYWETVFVGSTPPFDNLYELHFSVTEVAATPVAGFPFVGTSMSMPTGDVPASTWGAAALAIPNNETLVIAIPDVVETTSYGTDRVIAKVPNGDVIESNPAYVNQDDREDYYEAWRRPSISPYYTFKARVSVFGESQHAAISKNLAKPSDPKIGTHGLLFTDEFDPSASEYNFIGYI